jgi:hypothetical protein
MSDQEDALVPTAADSLLHALVASFNDPEPHRAFRYRPFVYRTTRWRTEDAAPSPRAHLRLRVPVVGRLLAAWHRLGPAPRPAPACCQPACC